MRSTTLILCLSGLFGLLYGLMPIVADAQPLPWDDNLELTPYGPSSVNHEIPYFTDENTGNPIDIEFSGTFCHTNSSAGVFYVRITCNTVDYDDGPFVSADGVQYPYTTLEVTSSEYDRSRIWWSAVPNDGNAWLDVRVDEQ